MNSIVLSTFFLLLACQYIQGRFNFNFENGLLQAADGAHRDVSREILNIQKKMDKLDKKHTDKAVDKESVRECLKDLHDAAVEEMNEQNTNSEDCVTSLKENIHDVFADKTDFWAIIAEKKKFQDEIKNCKNKPKDAIKDIFKKYEQEIKACLA